MKEIPMNFKNDGKIVGILHKVQQPRALVILVHGFTGSINGPGGTSWKKLAKELAKKNFDVFRFNFRYTSPGWREFHKMTISGEVSDLKFLLRKFSKIYNKIGLVGESLGGAISFLTYGKSVKSLVLWYPVSSFNSGGDFQKRFETPSALRELKEKGYVTIEKLSTGEIIRVGKDFIAERKKTNIRKNVRKVSCPTLIVSSTKDTIVRPQQSVESFSLIKSRNKKLFKIKSDHSWWIPGRKKRDWKSEKLAINQTTNWLSRWLK